MDMSSYSSSAVTVLELNGRVDSYSVPALRAQLDECADRRPAYIVINLSGVSFIDSSGLAALVQGMHRCRTGGGNLCLASPQRPVRIILELTRLDSAIDIFLNESEAIASFPAVA